MFSRLRPFPYYDMLTPHPSKVAKLSFWTYKMRNVASNVRAVMAK